MGLGAGTIFTFTEYGGQRADVESPPKPRLRVRSVLWLSSFLEGHSSLSSVPQLSPPRSLVPPSMLHEDGPSTNPGASVWEERAGCPDTEPPALASPRVGKGGARSVSETLCSAWECLYLTNSLPTGDHLVHSKSPFSQVLDLLASRFDLKAWVPLN